MKTDIYHPARWYQPVLIMVYLKVLIVLKVKKHLNATQICEGLFFVINNVRPLREAGLLKLSQFLATLMTFYS